MSGGVDSSVAALLVAREPGVEVAGAMMRFWHGPGENQMSACCSPDAAHAARRAADRIGIPFYVLDFREPFERHIRADFVAEYESGRTPNPCVRCNSEVKFGALLERARAMGFDAVATGHYARLRDGAAGREVHRSADAAKDQTYFLWGLRRDALPRVEFPVGSLTKSRVREIARESGLANADRPESQEICFVPGTTAEYLDARLGERPGPIVDTSGKRLGEHSGTHHFTIGQRKGLGLAGGPWFVVRLDAPSKTVVVGHRDDCAADTAEAEGASFLAPPAELPRRVLAQVRHRQAPAPATLESTRDTFRLHFDEPQFAVTPGQSIVLYSGSRLLGGGLAVSPVRTRALPLAIA
jgi:tRNA-specific 2-thiouridylase